MAAYQTQQGLATQPGSLCSLVNARVRNNIVQHNGRLDSSGNSGFDLASPGSSTGMNSYCNVIDIGDIPGENGFAISAGDGGNDTFPPAAYFVAHQGNGAGPPRRRSSKNA